MDKNLIPSARRFEGTEGHQQRTLKRSSSLSNSMLNKSQRSDRQHRKPRTTRIVRSRVCIQEHTAQRNVVAVKNNRNHVYNIGCAFTLHSIINNGLIPGGQDSSKRQTVFFLPIDPGHQDPAHIDFSVPRRAQYLHSAWKKHQDAVFWVDIDLAIRKGLMFYQTRSNAINLQGTLPAYCIPKVVKLKTGEVLYEKSYMSL